MNEVEMTFVSSSSSDQDQGQDSHDGQFLFALSLCDAETHNMKALLVLFGSLLRSGATGRKMKQLFVC